MAKTDRIARRLDMGIGAALVASQRIEAGPNPTRVSETIQSTRPNSARGGGGGAGGSGVTPWAASLSGLTFDDYILHVNICLDIAQQAYDLCIRSGIRT